MAQVKFPKELDTKVDVRALRAKAAGWAVIKEWIAKRVTQLLGGLEEEVLIGFIFNQLETDSVRRLLHTCNGGRVPDVRLAAAPVVTRRLTHANRAQAVNPKEMHVNLIPFLEKNTSLFMKVRTGPRPTSAPA